MPYHYPNLNPDKALVWRIVHRDNLDWILDNGLHCGNGAVRSDAWVSIGSEELISKRATHPVPIEPGGFLNDYVPFYFTPFSVMMKNIHSGRGVKQRPNEEIVILVSSVHHLKARELPVIFTDSHAYYAWAGYYSDIADLAKIDWPLLQRRDFKRDPDDPAKFERYQAEALVHRELPVDGLLGIICYTDQLRVQLEKKIADRGLTLKVHARKEWYF